MNLGARGRGAPEFFLYPDEISYWEPADSLAILKLLAPELEPLIRSGPRSQPMPAGAAPADGVREPLELAPQEPAEPAPDQLPAPTDSVPDEGGAGGTAGVGLPSPQAG